MKITSLLIFSFLFQVTVFAQAEEVAAPPRPSSEILDEAMQQAQKEGKKIFVIFHASWCGWCKKMDNAINDEACKASFERNYVLVHLDVLERGNKEGILENPGAEDFMNDHGGESQGLPYWIVLSENGKLLADSKVRPEGAAITDPGNNVGCPASEEEVAQLLHILQTTGNFEEKELKAIEQRFRKNEQ